MIRAIAAMLLLAGCAEDMKWAKPGATQASFAKDDYACRRDAIMAGGTVVNFGTTSRQFDMNTYKLCMRASGYQKG